MKKSIPVIGVFFLGSALLVGCGTEARVASPANQTTHAKSPTHGSCPITVAANNLMTPPPNATVEALATLNTYLKHHSQHRILRALTMVNVNAGPASQSAHASDIQYLCGKRIVHHLWWVAAGEAGASFTQFSHKHPALINDYYFAFTKSGRIQIVVY